MIERETQTLLFYIEPDIEREASAAAVEARVVIQLNCILLSVRLS
jgi:hypothetical protein